ncbi:MAG: CRISPR-associated endoribonuclease Cas6 [bacterium]|nr:CRISPR-associated endoribonuclease Cas6 [bacterium]
MRIKVSLKAVSGTSIPIEYNYNMYLGIRKLLFNFLSMKKPKLAGNYKKGFPDFTFSQLMIPDRNIEYGFIEISGNYLSFFASSIDDVLMEYMVRAINAAGEFSVHGKRFSLRKVELLEEPVFQAEMKFRMMSPLLLIKQEGKSIVFIRPEDSDLNDIFRNQLVKKYNKIHGTRFKPDDITIFPDQSYLECKRNMTRLLTIRNINYKTIFVPFMLRGDEELIRFAYINGIGSKTQYGLGMIDIIQ